MCSGLRKSGTAWQRAVMILRALSLSLRQLGDARTVRLVALVAGLTLLVFAVLGAALWAVLDQWILPRWFAGASGYAALIALGITILSAWLLFRAVAMAVMGLFADGIVESVEEDHYPAAAARAVPIGFGKGVRMGLKSARRALGWNLLAAPFYLMLLVTGVGTLALALIVNAALLGRDLEDMVRARHPALPALAKGERWGLGLIAAAAFLVPVAGLVAPVLGAAMAVHMLHGRRHMA
jgi:CysZ protein